MTPFRRCATSSCRAMAKRLREVDPLLPLTSSNAPISSRQRISRAAKEPHVLAPGPRASRRFIRHMHCSARALLRRQPENATHPSLPARRCRRVPCSPCCHQRRRLTRRVSGQACEGGRGKEGRGGVANGWRFRFSEDRFAAGSGIGGGGGANRGRDIDLQIAREGRARGRSAAAPAEAGRVRISTGAGTGRCRSPEPPPPSRARRRRN